MKEIVKILLEKGIDKETIHEVLEVISEKDGDLSRVPLGRKLNGAEASAFHYGDKADKYWGRAENAHGYRRQVNIENAQDAEKLAAKHGKTYRETKSEILDNARKSGKTNPEAHQELDRYKRDTLH